MKKEKYLDNKQKKLNKKLIDKISYKNYKENDFIELDVDSNHQEKAFTDFKYYKAMEEVSLLQKKALFLLTVYGFRIKQVAKMLNVSEKVVTKLKKQAIKNFKKNLKKEN